MSGFVQRVYVVIEAGNDEAHLMQVTPITGPVDMDARKHYRDEREIARVLRATAKKIEQGMSFRMCRLEVPE